MNAAAWILLVVATAWVLAAVRVPGFIWAAALAAIIALWDAQYQPPAWLLIIAWTAFFIIVLPLIVSPLRRRIFSAPLLRLFRRIMPSSPSAPAWNCVPRTMA